MAISFFFSSLRSHRNNIHAHKRVEKFSNPWDNVRYETFPILLLHSNIYSTKNRESLSTHKVRSGELTSVDMYTYNGYVYKTRVIRILPFFGMLNEGKKIVQEKKKKNNFGEIRQNAEQILRRVSEYC